MTSWTLGNPFVGDGLPSSTGYRELLIFVTGRPAPQGSKNQFRAESSKYVKPWRTDVRAALLADGRRFAGPVFVAVHFVLRRPKVVKDAMTGLGRNVGDGDKLTRATWDAIASAGTIEDDSRILSWAGSKRLAEVGEKTGAWITIRPHDGRGPR